MTNPPYLIHVHDSTGHYEIRLQGTIILSITRFQSDNFMTRLRWDDLEEDVKEQIITQVRRKLKE